MIIRNCHLLSMKKNSNYILKFTLFSRMKQRDQEKRLLTEKVTELEDKVRYDAPILYD